MTTVALVTHPDCLLHDPGPGHPECPERLRAVLTALDAPGFAPLRRLAAPLATREQLVRVHDEAVTDAILALHPAEGERLALDADTIVGTGSLAAARRAAGAAIAAVDAVMNGTAARAFAAVRPPGHHAERRRPMGFCLFNGIAVAAMHARARWGLRRIAIVDFDVHHGNGTQDVADTDAELLYVSSHQMPCYPGTGAAGEAGCDGNVVNLPLPPGTDASGFCDAWSRIGLPAIAAFAPELLLVSAGFDAHRADPLAQCRLETADFGWITDALVAASAPAGGRFVSVLEGGYDIPALAACAALHVRRLMN